MTLMGIAGFVLLLLFAVAVGASMDTERQRAAGRRVAAKRRRLHEEQRVWRESRALVESRGDDLDWVDSDE